MAICPILSYPHPGLSEVCRAVEIFDDKLAGLANDLLDTMRAAPGVGITGAHIGVPLRIFVLELSTGTVKTFVNPEIVSVSDEMMRHIEGSVSMPGFTEEVDRPAGVLTRFQDLDGNWHEEESKGFEAICIQHKIDQLDGMFWLKRLSKLKRDRLVRKWEKSRRG